MQNLDTAYLTHDGVKKWTVIERKDGFPRISNVCYEMPGLFSNRDSVCLIHCVPISEKQINFLVDVRYQHP